MAMTPSSVPREPKRGIALLVTLIFMSVMLAFGLALASLAYKQTVLSSTATQSVQAFYAADGALECALYADQQEQAYNYSDWTALNLPDATKISDACNGTIDGAPTVTWTSGSGGRLTVIERISFNGGASCADITLYKYASPLTDGSRAYIFSTGYNVACSAIAVSGARIVARGINEHY